MRDKKREHVSFIETLYSNEFFRELYLSKFERLKKQAVDILSSSTDLQEIGKAQGVLQVVRTFEQVREHTKEDLNRKENSDVRGTKRAREASYQALRRGAQAGSN